jgi:hypothetical protein
MACSQPVLVKAAGRSRCAGLTTRDVVKRLQLARLRLKAATVPTAGATAGLEGEVSCRKANLHVSHSTNSVTNNSYSLLRTLAHQWRHQPGAGPANTQQRHTAACRAGGLLHGAPCHSCHIAAHHSPLQGGT